MFDKLQRIAQSLGLEMTETNKWYFLRKKKQLILKTQTLDDITDKLKRNIWERTLRNQTVFFRGKEE